MEHKLSTCSNTNGESLPNQHTLCFGNSGIVLGKHIPSRFDDGKYAL